MELGKKNFKSSAQKKVPPKISMERTLFNRKCFAKLKAKMNFDDIVWLPLFFCVCDFHPFVLLLSDFFSTLSMSLLTFSYSFSKYIWCKFFAYIFAISAYTKAERPSAGMSEPENENFECKFSSVLALAWMESEEA